MAKLGLGVDLILTSPLTRAVQTAEIAADGLGLVGRVCEEEGLGFGFDMRDVARLLAEHSDREGIMLVGHEPSFSWVVGALTGGSRILFKKGALARVDLADEEEPRGELVWLIPPKAMV